MMKKNMFFLTGFITLISGSLACAEQQPATTSGPQLITAPASQPIAPVLQPAAPSTPQQTAILPMNTTSNPATNQTAGQEGSQAVAGVATTSGVPNTQAVPTTDQAVTTIASTRVMTAVTPTEKSVDQMTLEKAQEVVSNLAIEADRLKNILDEVNGQFATINTQEKLKAKYQKSRIQLLEVGIRLPANVHVPNTNK